MRGLSHLGNVMSKVALSCTLSAAISCTASESDKKEAPDPVEDASDALFALPHRVEVAVELAPADWQKLRSEGRGVSALAGDLTPYEYTYFPATVTVDGVRHEQSAVRKKGFLGSLSALRPSLKIQFDREIKGAAHAGMHELTLNNNRQDPSNTHQCLAYRLYARAGLPAPRCNLAHVVVNGEDLGTFSNVESIDKAFLARHFDDPSGNLYEAQRSDFVAGEVDRIELKTNKKKGERSDIQAIVTALNSSDAELPSALGKVIDLQSFRSAWALDVLMGNWDGYSGNANNYQIYHDPISDRFFFLPWGADAAFQRSNPFDVVNTSIALYAKGIIARRLYALPAERALYRQRLSELNEALWDETLLLSEVDQIAQNAADAEPALLDQQRNLIRSQKAQMRAALSEPAPEWIALDAQRSPCTAMTSDVQGTFSTMWGDLDVMTPEMGHGGVALSVDGNPITAGWLGKAGLDPSSGLGTGPVIRLATGLQDGTVLSVHLQMAPNMLKPGVTAFHGVETVGALVVVKDGRPRIVGFIGDGAITLERGETRTDAPVVGSFAGQLVQIDCMR